MILTVCFILAAFKSPAGEPISNPLIDYGKFEEIVINSRAERESRRLTEDQFLSAMKQPGVVVLDARSASMFARRHVAGAVSLPFTDFTAESIAGVIHGKDAKILIYCNNNFLGSPVAFASKAPPASLNLSTYTSLKAYGYTNVFELGPLLKISATKIPFAGTELR